MQITYGTCCFLADDPAYFGTTNKFQMNFPSLHNSDHITLDKRIPRWCWKIYFFIKQRHLRISIDKINNLKLTCGILCTSRILEILVLCQTDSQTKILIKEMENGKHIKLHRLLFVLRRVWSCCHFLKGKWQDMNILRSTFYIILFIFHQTQHIISFGLSKRNKQNKRSWTLYLFCAKDCIWSECCTGICFFVPIRLSVRYVAIALTCY